MAKKAIIIGASSGIGNSLAREMSKAGYVLGLTGRRKNLLEELQRALPNKSFVSDFDVVEVEKAVNEIEKLIEQMEGVDVIVVNAGVGRSNEELRMKAELLTVDVNVRGFTAMTNFAFNHFKKKGSGHIVGISSMLAITGSGTAPAYSASKAFVSSYLECIRRRANQQNLNMIVTDIKPGFVDTPMTKDNSTMFWVSSPDKAAAQILSTIRRGRDHAYVTRRWKIIGWLMKLVPNAFLQKL